MGYGDKLQIGPYTLVCRSYTQDDNPNYGSEWAVMDVFKGGRQITTMTPERRFYKASQQISTMPTVHSTAKEDLYLVYEGINQGTGRPIIKAHLNPLVMWIWVGVWTMIIGTIVALVPNAVPVRVSAPAPLQTAAPVGAGD
jgi:cytochrome c-type biogenesis protein CcmF